MRTKLIAAALLTGTSRIEIDSDAAICGTSQDSLQGVKHVGGGYDADQLRISSTGRLPTLFVTSK